MTLLRAGLAALLCLLSLLAHADAAHKQKIVLDTTAAGADLKQPVAQLPLAVRLHSGNFTFADARPDGSDLRFFAADGKTPLKFHIEQFDAPNELAVAWVLVPGIAGNAKAAALQMAWGDASAESAADARGTYDASQIFVLHFSDKDGVHDATANGNNAAQVVAKPVAAGPMGGSLEFDGAGQVRLPASASLKVGAGGFTFTAWVKPGDAGNGRLLALGSADAGLTIELAAGVPVVTLGKAQVKGSGTLKPGVWQHVAVTAGGGKLAILLDGKEAGGGDFTLADTSGEAVIGERYKGELDEVTLAGVARSADYVKALAASQMAESPMFVVDSDAGEGGGVSYFSILLGAVTPDGWVVIGILGVMFVISVWVMITKTRLLLRTRKSNANFLARFEGAARDMLSPGTPAGQRVAADPALKQSSVARLYAIGLREIAHRFQSLQDSGGELLLSAPALESIRASLDAAMLRENQRLNSQIVLLTIAISGGPFLGLLGTVVGVMITFAAIAAAGDVNVNSIAPGIAAALVATVAGLAVAIPALFGYNWLAAQIKNVSADMQVFADEFVTKAAELHSR